VFTGGVIAAWDRVVELDEADVLGALRRPSTATGAHGAVPSAKTTLQRRGLPDPVNSSLLLERTEV